MMLSEFLVAVIWGILITLFLEILGVLVWFYSISDIAPSPMIPINDAITAETPRSVNKSCYANRQTSLEQQTGSQQGESHESPESVSVESCNWLNCLIDFVFHQLRDSSELKKLMMKQINKEFTELLLTKTEGKMLERLSVREYNMGTCLPVLSNISVVKAEKDDSGTPKVVEVEMDVEYNGGFQLSIDADLVFNKAAFVSVKVNLVRGRGRLHFSTIGFTNWSFAFLSDPELDLTVGSRFEGRELSQLSVFMKAQIIRWIKRIHTLPNYKIRFKPFFKKIRYQDQMLDVHVHNSRITQGELRVKIIECSKLVLTDTAVDLSCTVSVGETPIDARVGYWQGMWPCREVHICRKSHQEPIGIKYSLYPCSDEGRKSMVIVTAVTLNSPAYDGGIHTGDILQKIENITVTSVSQANRLIKNARGLRLLITIRRPTVNIFKLLQQRKEEYEKNLKKKKNRSKSPNPTRQPKGATLVTGTSLVEETPRENDEEDQEQVEEDEEGVVTSQLRDKDREWDSEKEDDMADSFERITSRRSKKMMKDGAVSTPLNIDTNAHRPLIAGLEEDDSHGSFPTPCPSTNNSEQLDGAANNNPNEGSLESHDSHKTKSVSVTRNPKWNKEFRYTLAPKHQYLNVCVWSRLQGENKNIMIGSVTISLTDIALECATSGHHQQRYVLLPAKDVRTSKTALKALTDLPGSAKFSNVASMQKFVGDILLSFKHIHKPQEALQNQGDSSLETPIESSGPLEAENTSKFEFHPFTAEKGREPDKHCFEPLELRKDKKLCYVCQEKIRKKAMECVRCKMMAHRKCVKYCITVVPCKAKESYNQEREQWEEIKDDEVYLDSRQDLLLKGEDSTSIGSMPTHTGNSLEEIEKELAFIDGPDVTPPESNSDTDGEMEREQIDNTSLSDFVDIISLPELEEKILIAQSLLVMLEEKKRTLFSEDHFIPKEDLDYKLQKLDAQKETTNIKLQEYKDTMRKMYQ